MTNLETPEALAEKIKEILECDSDGGHVDHTYEHDLNILIAAYTERVRQDERAKAHEMRRALEILIDEWSAEDPYPDAPTTSIHGIARSLRAKHIERLRKIVSPQAAFAKYETKGEPRVLSPVAYNTASIFCPYCGNAHDANILCAQSRGEEPR